MTNSFKHRCGPIRRYVPITILTTCSLMLAACGGGGGSSAQPLLLDNPGGQSGGVIPSSGIDQPPVAAASCSADLRDVIPRNTGEVPGGRLEDISAACDYLVSSSMRISGDVAIAPGVSFVLQPGVDLTFQGDASLVGTAQSPIRFLPEQAGSHWGQVKFSGDSTTIAHTLFAEGGARTEDNASVSLVRGGSSNAIQNTTISGSRGNGLALGGSNATLEMFQNNVLQGNAGYGLVLETLELAEGLNANNDFQGVQTANAKQGVLVGGSRASAAVIRNIGVPYVVEEGNRSSFGSADVLSLTGTVIEAGVAIQFASSVALELSSSTINGTAELPVILTSLDPGDPSWGGVILNSRGNVIRHALIENAGGGSSSGGGAISTGRFSQIDDSRIENIQIVNAQSWGVFCSESPTEDEPSQVLGLSITGSIAGDIHPSCQITVSEEVVPDGPRIDIAECAETVVAYAQVQGPFRFMNTDAVCDYFVAGELKLSSTLLIDPGVTIVFARGASLNVAGTVTAVGTAGLPITLRGEVESDGYWDGVAIESAGHRLDHVSIVDGGIEGGEALRAFRGTLDSRVLISLAMNNTTVSGSLGDGVTIAPAVDLSGFSSNTFIGNAGVGLSLGFDALVGLDAETLYDSPMAPNGLEGIQVVDSSQSGGGNVRFNREQATLLDKGAPYRISQLNVADDSGLTIEAGVQLVMTNGGLISVARDSTVVFNGTATEPVVIRPARDQAEGFKGLTISTSTITATHLSIIGAGAVDAVSTQASDRGAITLSNGQTIANLSDVTISDSEGWAIDCDRTNAVNFQFSNLSYANNALGDINPECGS